MAIVTLHPYQNLTTIVFIDGSLSDLQTILTGLDPSVTAIVLDPAQDGIQQMADALAGMSGLDAIHIISHGASGQINLGTAQFSQDTLAQYQTQLATIGHALSTTGDLLLYGCNVAQGDAGQAFITALANATGADVAASTDLTGADFLGGNWVLEANTGSIEASSLNLGATYAHTLYVATTTNLTFNVAGQNMWGSGQSIALSSTFDQLQWNPAIPYTSTNPILGTDLHYQLSGSIGPSFALSANTGSIDLSYPIQVDVRTPNAVHDGDRFIVDTSSWRVVNPALNSVGPTVSAHADLNFALNANFGVDLAGFNIPSLQQNLSFNKSTTFFDTSQYSSGNYSLGGVVGVGYNLPTNFNAQSAYLGTSNSLVSVNASARQADYLLYVNCDAVNLARYFFPEIPPLSGQISGSLGIPLLGTATANLDYTLLDINMAAGIKLAQDFTFVPTGVTCTLQSSTGETHSGSLGQQFEFTAPSAGSGDLGISATYTLSGQLHNQSGVVVGGQIDTSALGFNFSTNLLPNNPISIAPLQYQIGASTIPYYLYDTYIPLSFGTGSATYSVHYDPTVIQATNHQPTATGTDRTVAAGTSISLSQLFSYSDPDAGDSITAFALRDRSVGGGYLTLNGVAQAENTLFDNIPISQIGQWAFVAGAGGSVDTIGFNAYDTHGAYNSSVTASVTAQAHDTSPPTLSSASPGDNTIGVALGADIRLAFNENVVAGSGNIDIHRADGTIFRSIAITDTSQVAFSGNTVTINPGVDLAASSDYYVTVASGAIRDLAGNNFAGISSGTTLNFTTWSAPYVPPAQVSSTFMSVTDTTVLEGASGTTTTLSFCVNLTGAGAGTQTVSVSYATQDIAGAAAPATAGQDYVATSGVLTIPAGQTSGLINVTVVGDNLLEPDEVFRLVLSQPSSGVTLLNSAGQSSATISGTGSITNDDQAQNHVPIAKYDLAITAPNTPVLMDFLANDTDPDGDALHLTSVNTLAGSTYAISGNQVLVTPDAGFTGVLKYWYGVGDSRDGVGGFAEVIVSGDGTPGITNSGTAGNDIISGTGGNDTLSGGFGDDIIAGGGGSDRIDGGAGFNYLDLRQAGHGASIQFRDPWTWDNGDGGHDILQNMQGVLGSRYDDSIDGSSGNIEYITTGYRFYGNDGNDTLQGDAGDDVLDGGSGNDTLIFGAGRDIVFGGAGNDRIYSFTGFSDTVGDTLYGGLGDDFIYSSDGASADRVFGDEGNDYIQFSNGDIVSGGTGADTFRLAGFNSTNPYHATITDLSVGESIRWSFPTGVVITGPQGFDMGVTFVGPITNGTGVSTALDHVEFATAGGQTTLYFGYDSNPGADFILSIAGTFTLDQLQVDTADPTNLGIIIQGGSGDDIIAGGGSGSNNYDGGGGIDTIDYSGTTQGIVIDLSAASNQATGAEIGTDQITNVENVIGGSGDDLVTGNGGNNVLVGGVGADTLTGGAGNDTFRYTANTDSIAAAFDTITDFQSGDHIEFTGMAGMSWGANHYTFTTSITQTVAAIQADASSSNALVQFSDGTNNYLYIKGAGSGVDFGGTLVSFTGTNVLTSSQLTGGVANNAPTGTVTISGTATQGQTLTATNNLADADGLGAITYQWQSNGANITGATNNTYLLTQTEIGKAISVIASYTDLHGTAEAVTSSSVNVSAPTTSRYTMQGSGASFMDFYMPYGNLSLDGQNIVFKGNAGVDSIYVGSANGLAFDFTQSLGSADKIYLSGNWADYSRAASGSVVTLTRTNGGGETIKTLSGDSLVFADGTVPVLDALNYTKGTVTTAPVPVGETSAAFPMSAPAGLNNTVRAVVQDATGEVIALARHGVNMVVKGNSGVDMVYVAPGENVDATQLLGSQDKLYLTGQWADYSGAYAGSVVTLTRPADIGTETVKFLGGSASAYDSIVFADGTANSIDILNYLKGTAAAPILSTTEVTPLGTGDIVAGTTGTEVLNGTVAADVIYGNGGADTINGGAGSDTIVITDAGTTANNSATILLTSTANGTDTVIGFSAAPVASGGDVLDFSAIAHLTKSVATGQTLATDFAANNVFIFDGTPITIADAASAIAADVSVVATDGYIVIADSANHNAVTAYHSTDLAGNGAETALVILSGVNINNLTAANFLV